MLGVLNIDHLAITFYLVWLIQELESENIVPLLQLLELLTFRHIHLELDIILIVLFDLVLELICDALVLLQYFVPLDLPDEVAIASRHSFVNELTLSPESHCVPSNNISVSILQHIILFGV